MKKDMYSHLYNNDNKSSYVLAILIAMQLIIIIAVGVGQDQAPDITTIHLNLRGKKAQRLQGKSKVSNVH